MLSRAGSIPKVISYGRRVALQLRRYKVTNRGSNNAPKNASKLNANPGIKPKEMPKSGTQVEKTTKVESQVNLDNPPNLEGPSDISQKIVENTPNPMNEASSEAKPSGSKHEKDTSTSATGLLGRLALITGATLAVAYGYREYVSWSEKQVSQKNTSNSIVKPEEKSRVRSSSTTTTSSTTSHDTHSPMVMTMKESDLDPSLLQSLKRIKEHDVEGMEEKAVSGSVVDDHLEEEDADADVDADHSTESLMSEEAMNQPSDVTAASHIIQAVSVSEAYHTVDVQDNEDGDSVPCECTKEKHDIPLSSASVAVAVPVPARASETLSSTQKPSPSSSSSSSSPSSSSTIESSTPKSWSMSVFSKYVPKEGEWGYVAPATPTPSPSNDSAVVKRELPVVERKPKIEEQQVVCKCNENSEEPMECEYPRKVTETTDPVQGKVSSMKMAPVNEESPISSPSVDIAATTVAATTGQECTECKVESKKPEVVMDVEPLQETKNITHDDLSSMTVENESVMETTMEVKPTKEPEVQVTPEILERVEKAILQTITDAESTIIHALPDTASSSIIADLQRQLRENSIQEGNRTYSLLAEQRNELEREFENRLREAKEEALSKAQNEYEEKFSQAKMELENEYQEGMDRMNETFMYSLDSFEERKKEEMEGKMLAAEAEIESKWREQCENDVESVYREVEEDRQKRLETLKQMDSDIHDMDALLKEKQSMVNELLVLQDIRQRFIELQSQSTLGQPIHDTIQSLRSLSAKDPILVHLLDALPKAYCSQPPPSSLELLSEFESMYEDVRVQSKTPMFGGSTGSMLGRITASLVGTEGVPDSDPLKQLSMMRKKVWSGDLEGVLLIAKQITGPSKDMLNGWVDKVQSRVTFDRVLEQTQDHLAAKSVELSVVSAIESNGNDHEEVKEEEVKEEEEEESDH